SIFDLTGQALVTFGEAGPQLDVLGIPVRFDLSYTNAHFTMLLVIALLTAVSLLATRTLREEPRGLQNLIELLVQGLADFVESIGGTAALKYLPLFGTLLLFLVISNWLSVVPFVGRGLRIFHPPTADYHTNFGLAIVAFALYQTEGVR